MIENPERCRNALSSDCIAAAQVCSTRPAAAWDACEDSTKRKKDISLDQLWLVVGIKHKLEIGCFDLIKQDFYGWRERYRVCFFSYLAHWHSFKKHSKIFRSEVVIARYTRHIMAWVIGPQWITCFDLVCMIWFLWFHWGEKPDKTLALQVGVDACKPRFFQAGTPLQVKSEKDNQVKTWAPSKARTW